MYVRYVSPVWFVEPKIAATPGAADAWAGPWLSRRRGSPTVDVVPPPSTSIICSGGFFRNTRGKGVPREDLDETPFSAQHQEKA